MVAAQARPLVLGQLLPVLPRLLRWRPFVVAFATASGLIGWKYGEVQSPEGGVWLFRFVVLVLVVGAVFLLDDASSNVTAPSPTPLRIRSGVRLVVAGLSLLCSCGVAYLVLATATPLSRELAGLALEATSIAAVAGASSLALARWRGIPEPGQFAGLCALGAMFAAHLIGVRWPMLALPGADWNAAHYRWFAVLGLAVLVIVICLRDLAATSWRSRLFRGSSSLGA
jgi:hypothetical protein